MGTQPRRNPAMDTPEPCGNFAAPRTRHRTVYGAANARMILFGGGPGGTSPCANEVWVLANANGVGGSPTWWQLNPSGPTPLQRLLKRCLGSATNTLAWAEKCAFFRQGW